MKPSTPQIESASKQFLAMAGAVTLSAAVLTVGSWPFIKKTAQSQSRQLTMEAAKQQGNEAVLDYKLAYWLDHTNGLAALQLAKYNLSIGQPDIALKQLGTAGESPEATRLRLRTELELNRRDAVAQTAHRLINSSSTDNDVLLAATALAATQQRDQLPSLASRLSSPEATQRLQSLQSSTTAIGLELYTLGLLNSSQRLLQSEPASLPRNIALAAILTRTPSAQNLQHARDLYLAALRLDPSNIVARQALVGVYTSLGNRAAADEQSKLVAKLQAGRP